jgi:hypothetical protein
MKPGKLCKTSQKISYASHEEAIRKGMEIYSRIPVKEFSAYPCPDCKCWHITTHPR